MTRYTDKQKLAAVMAYRGGTGGLRDTASAHGVGVDSLRAWIAAYEAHGEAGLLGKRRVIYDLSVKLEALRRMRDEGLSCRQVSALFNIRRLDLVAEWSRLYDAHGAAALRPGWKWEQTRMSRPPSKQDDRDAVTDNQRSRDELLRDLQQLRAENAYLKKCRPWLEPSRAQCP